MRKRTLGATGIEVTELSLGTWGLSGDGYGVMPHGEARRVIERARAIGITLFETAPSYGMGAMERELGEVLKDDPEVTIVTKWGTDRTGTVAKKRFDRDYLRSAHDESKKLLGDKVRLVGLLHNPSPHSLKDGSACATLAQFVTEKSLTAWGASVGSSEVASVSLESGAQVMSFAYNIFNVQPLRSLTPALAEKKVGVLAHSVLFYGLLTGRWSPGRTFASTDHRSERWPDGALRTRIQHLDAVRPLVSGEVATMRSAALRFVLSHSAVSSAIIGPRSGSQLDQVVRDCQGELPYLSEAKLSALEGRLAYSNIPR